MRVLLSNERGCVSCVEAQCTTAAEDYEVYDSNGVAYIVPECLLIYNEMEHLEIMLPMPKSEANNWIRKIASNTVVDMTVYCKRTFFNPKSNDVERIIELIEKNGVCHGTMYTAALAFND